MSNNRRIVFKYIEVEGVEEVFVDGAYGGFNPNGNIHIDFFTETKKPHIEEKKEMLPDGTLKPINEDEDIEIHRRKVAKIVMNANTAKSVANWLIMKVEQFEETGGHKPNNLA